jgi:hypothetical protein
VTLAKSSMSCDITMADLMGRLSNASSQLLKLFEILDSTRDNKQ